jgi:hypothetical protein
MFKGNCTKCGRRKAQFVGDGIFDSIGSWVKGAANKVADTAKSAYNKTIGDDKFVSGFKKGFGGTFQALGAPAGAIINSFAPGVGSVAGAAISHAGKAISGGGVKRRRTKQ